MLDLGCGAGVPATRWLAGRFAVTGVDVSARQLELARRYVPAATFLKADMTGADFEPETFDAAVALHSMIHVPRAEQPGLLARVRRWLKPGGVFLATWANTGWEDEEENWGGWDAPMWCSHHDGETSLGMMRGVGFAVGSAEERTVDGENWLWVLARRRV